MSTITATAFQNYFVFDRNLMEVCEHGFSEELLLQNPLTINEVIGYARENCHHMESYYADKALAKKLNLEKVKACFERIKNYHLENKVVYLNAAFGWRSREDTLESAFCNRVFKRLSKEKQKEISDLYVEQTEEETELLKGRRNARKAFEYVRDSGCLLLVREKDGFPIERIGFPVMIESRPLTFEEKKEQEKWLLQRDAWVLHEIEGKLGRYSNNPEETLTSIAHMESKEREIEEKTRKARRSILGILFIELYPIFAFSKSCYYKVKGSSMRCFAILTALLNR